MNHYRHTQFGWAVLIPVLIALALALAIMFISAETPRAIPWLVAGLLAVVLMLFSTLTVTVTDGWLECRFGLGLIRRRIRLSDVRSAGVVRNKWYYGWGIRLTPHGWLWNVAGLDGVQLTFANGKRFRIGTDEPAKLLKAINGSLLVGSS